MRNPILIAFAALLCLCAVRGQAWAQAAAARANSAAPLDEHAMLRAVASMYRLDPALLDAIAHTESDFDPNAVSPAGALGLMQLMPATARRFGVRDPFDPVQNALGAARFIDYLQSLGLAGAGDNAPTPAMIAAYNAGPRAVAEFGGVPPYPETRQYVRRVMWRYFFNADPPAPAPVLERRVATTRRASVSNPDLSLLRELARLRRRALAARSKPAPVLRMER